VKGVLGPRPGRRPRRPGQSRGITGVAEGGSTRGSPPSRIPQASPPDHRCGAGRDRCGGVAHERGGPGDSRACPHRRDQPRFGLDHGRVDGRGQPVGRSKPRRRSGSGHLGPDTHRHRHVRLAFGGSSPVLGGGRTGKLVERSGSGPERGSTLLCSGRRSPRTYRGSGPRRPRPSPEQPVAEQPGAEQPTARERTPEHDAHHRSTAPQPAAHDHDHQARHHVGRDQAPLIRDDPPMPSRWPSR